MGGKWYGYARSSNNKDKAETCPIFNWIQTSDGRTLFVFSDISTLYLKNFNVLIIRLVILYQANFNFIIL